MKKWIDKNGKFWDGTSIVLDGMRIFNPSDEQLLAAGYTEYVEPEPTPEELLARAKQQKTAEIVEYDQSDAVNSFTIVMGEYSMEAWITPDQRANYKNSLDSAELLGLTEVHPVFNGIQLTLPIQLAKIELAKVQIYADRCFIVTETHKAAVEAMETVEEVEAFDITDGYPEKLVFDLNQGG